MYNSILTNKLVTKSLSMSKIESDTINARNIKTSILKSDVVSKEIKITGNATVKTAIIPTLTVDTYSVDTLSVPSIEFSTSTTTSVNTDNLKSATSNVTNSSTTDTTTDTLRTNQFYATDNIDVNNKLKMSFGKEKSEYYSSPNEGAFRGMCFFKDVDFGIESVATKKSMNMHADGNRTNFIQSYNKYLGRIDNDNTLGGSVALLSLCTATTPARTLRFQQDGNLAIYSDGTKIWQNGSMVSDRKLKENIVPITSAMTKILAIDGVTFQYNFGEKEQSCGVILEQIRDIYPECVVENLVHLELLVPLLVEGLKELIATQELIKNNIQNKKSSTCF